jgi:hypothetical protein
VPELAASTVREVRAWRYAWQQDWDSAARMAVEVFENLQAPGLRPYRALWAYLGSAWSARASIDDTSPAAQRSAELLRMAHASAIGTTWLKEVEPLPSATYDSDAVDREGVEAVLALLKTRLSSRSKFELESAAMLANLSQQEAPRYEKGLVALGQFLGAEAFKPAGKGRADAAWLWKSLWISLEAKRSRRPRAC